MANGVQLATAYISLNVRTDDIKKQVDAAFRDSARTSRAAGSRMGSNLADGLRNSFGGGTLSRLLFAPMELAGVRWARKAGVAIGGALKKAIMGAASLTGVGSLFAIGGVLTAGLDRLKTLQRSEVQLSLKLSPQEIKQVKADIVKVVEGTPISLDAALQAVPRAISSGLRGQELTQYIKDVADMTAATGGQASFEQLDIILGQIRSKGKLTGEEMAQLIDAGVDVRGILKETLGLDDSGLAKALKDGKVGINEIQKATQKLYGVQGGGLAKMMGQTFDGAVSLVKSSAARLGANILGVIFGDPNDPDGDPLKGAIDGLNGVTGKLNEAGEWVSENKTEIREVFTNIGNAVGFVADKITDVVDWFKRMGQTGKDIGSSLGRAWENVTTAIGKVGDKVKSVVDTIKTKMASIVDDVKTKFDAIFGENGWFAQQFKKVADLVDKVRDVLGLGPATASAAAPGGGTTPFNPGPMAPGAGAPGALTPALDLTGAAAGSNAGGLLGVDSSGVPMASSATRVPYGLPPGTDTGGYGTGNAKIFPAWVMELANRFGIQPSTYAGHQQDNRQEPGYAPNPNNENRGIDWVGPVENLQKFAEYLETIPHTMEQVIWQNPDTGRKTGIGGGKINPGYYDDGTYASHGGNDPNNIHVHTRQSMSIPPPAYASGGGVWGSGTGTSDSIPAMLSNGEHVLTAAEVKKMGGQGGVYNFRNMLNSGMIPGFAPGGGVDGDTLQDLQNNIADSQNSSIIAQQRFNETMNNADASEGDRLRAQIELEKALRSHGQLTADAPIIASGGTPPDRSKQNNVYDTTDQLALAQQALKDLPEDAPVSQRTAAQYAVDSALRGREQAVGAMQPGQKNYLDEFVRNAGFVPVAAGNTGVAGTSSLSSIIGMGNEVVSGMIDTGASLAQMAVSAAITGAAAAGSFGAGAAAAPAASAAASWGIQTAANVGKRVSAYGFQLASIGADSLIAQMMPFGAPRWLGYDYTSLMPQMGLQQAATTTLEQMGSDAINRHFNPQGKVPPMPQSPESTLAQDPTTGPTLPPAPVPVETNQAILQPGDPGYYVPPPTAFPFNPNGAGGGGGGGSWARGGHVGVYDQGGILNPGDIALNMSQRPEKVLTDKQWSSLANIKPAGRDSPMVKIDAIYGMSPEDVANQIESKQKLAMMRYAGRP